ncbi:CIA30 family protein [candidate division KSB3 bacterium]|uniref:CIA30 family protein n=1 Tax=candidate division KSB3 bacterium TaxID=2044937 RepID=A0A2G6KL56_9BACT|nr:MAG: CIA30 family protein [candidate division KSB3 bacterium]
MKQQEKMVIDFNNTDEIENWRIVNDGVMGGLSKSEIVLSDENTAIFQGTVSLEHYGGFASTRAISHDYKLHGYTGLLVRIKGDGRRYQLRIRTDDRFDGVSYRTHVDINADSWMTIRIPFADFVPVFRGRIVKDAPPISPENIHQIGFLIADKQAGDFRFEIDWIQAYNRERVSSDILHPFEAF